MNRTWKILTCICLILCLFAGGGAVSAQGNADTMTGDELKGLYQLTPEEEAAIVHNVPHCPVIIDGVKYEPEEISKFDGRRLWFTVDMEGNLYAFTSEKKIDAFHQEQKKLLAKEEPYLLLRSGNSDFFEDMNYGGTVLSLSAGSSMSSLGAMDNAISSFQLDPDISKASLFANTNYGGDVFERVGGTNISWLWIFGWNDVASSIIVYP